MKKLIIAGALLALASSAFAQSIGPPLIGCSKYFQVSQGAVALTKVISGVVGQSINLCGWAINAGAAAGTASISYGTGTNCGTGTTTILPVISLGINGVYVDTTPASRFSPPSVNASGVANDVCLVTTGTGPTAVIIWYSQQ